MRARSRWMVWAVLLLWASIPGAALAAGETSTNPPYIEVSAEAEMRATPDLALLEFGVVSRAASAAAAAQQNATRMKAVLAAVRQAVDSTSRLATGTYMLRAEQAQNRDGGEPRIAGYVASNIVRLETAQLSRLGEVIDVAIEAGANQVQRISFGLRDPIVIRRDALRDAVLRARADAETMAAALGLKLGAVLSLSNQDAGPVRPYMQEAMVARAAMAQTPIEPGQVSVRARVTLRQQVVR